MSADPAKAHFAEFQPRILRRHELTGMECPYVRADIVDELLAMLRAIDSMFGPNDIGMDLEREIREAIAKARGRE